MWAEHGIPADLTTRDVAAGVMGRLLDERDHLVAALDQVLTACTCHAGDQAQIPESG